MRQKYRLGRDFDFSIGTEASKQCRKLLKEVTAVVLAGTLSTFADAFNANQHTKTHQRIFQCQRITQLSEFFMLWL